MTFKAFERFCLPFYFISALLIFSCGDQAMKPVDLANPADESNDTSDLANDLDYSDGTGIFPDSSFVDFNDSTLNDSAVYLNSASVDTAAGIEMPAGSSLKTINAVFHSVDCDRSGCQLVFKTESDEDLVFCGAYGDFVSADFGTANRELVGKSFMVIYRATAQAVKDSTKKETNAPCNSIVFAKQN